MHGFMSGVYIVFHWSVCLCIPYNCKENGHLRLMTNGNQSCLPVKGTGWSLGTGEADPSMSYESAPAGCHCAGMLAVTVQECKSPYARLPTCSRVIRNPEMFVKSPDF